MTTARQVVNKAMEYLGVKEVPTGSNKVKFNTEYYGKVVSGSGYPWCCVFVWYVFKKAGASKLFYDGKKTAYCPTAENWYKEQGRYFKNGKVGDVCFMDFGKGRASHVGIVKEVLGNGAYKVIEGNTSVTSNDNGGKVMIRTRKSNVIRGFGRPKYDSEKLSYFDKCSKTTKSIVNALKEVGANSSFSYRKEIATANGITGYRGTASQNLKLLKLLKDGKLIKP